MAGALIFRSTTSNYIITLHFMDFSLLANVTLSGSLSYLRPILLTGAASPLHEAFRMTGIRFGSALTSSHFRRLAS